VLSRDASAVLVDRDRRLGDRERGRRHALWVDRSEGHRRTVELLLALRRILQDVADDLGLPFADRLPAFLLVAAARQVLRTLGNVSDAREALIEERLDGAIRIATVVVGEYRVPSDAVAGDVGGSASLGIRVLAVRIEVHRGRGNDVAEAAI